MSDQLAAIDDALETGAADHHDPLTRELQELALALRADAPEADPGFERRAPAVASTAGFPKPVSLTAPAAGAAHDPRLRDRAGGPAAGADRGRGRRLGSVGPERRRRRWRRRGGGEVAAPKRGSRKRAMALRARRRSPSARPDQAAGQRAAPWCCRPTAASPRGSATARSSARSALELEMPVDEMARVAEQVTTVTNRHGGFVLSSSVSTGEDPPAATSSCASPRPGSVPPCVTSPRSPTCARRPRPAATSRAST